jgi:CubicO group peptidase (beta-lactamase class C family)
MRKTVVLFISLFTILADGLGQQIRTLEGKIISATTIDKVIAHLMDTAEVTGLNLAIFNGNKAVYLKSYGYKNKETRELIDTATCFYGASFSKAVFAYIVMQLVQDGQLDLDKPIYQYLDKPIPAYEGYKDLVSDDRWKLITARHCLSHSTGFPNWRFFNPRGNKKLEIFFTPGSRYAYSGEGLVLLQLVIEKISGKNLEELAQEKVFKPLNMYRTSYLWQPAFESNFAIGYYEDEATRKSKRYKINAAGSMETTIADYSRFIAAVMQGKGLTQKAKQEMISPQIAIHTKRQFPSLNWDTTSDNKKIQLSYGLGWGVFKDQFGNAFFKEGHDDGWGHYNVNYPEKKFSIILMSNSSNGESIFQEIVEEIAGKTGIPWVWEGYTPYRGSVKLADSILKEYVGSYDTEKLQVSVFFEGGRLRIELGKGDRRSNMYAKRKDHFFVKTNQAEIEFVRDASGNVNRMVVISGSDRYELKRTNSVQPLTE